MPMSTQVTVTASGSSVNFVAIAHVEVHRTRRHVVRWEEWIQQTNGP
jgi:hypothetical protein